MKSYFLISVVAAAICSAAYANPNADIEARIKAMEERLSSVEKENAQLKSAVKTIQSEELGARMDDVEKIAFSNKIQFGLGMKNINNNFSGKLGNGTKYDNNNVMSTKLMLNMDSQITKDMKFTGRLSMYKNWANKDGFSGYDATDGRRPTDASVFVERAYVDWTVLDGVVPVVLTVGRQPSSDGPSHQFKDNTVRKSTYSALAFDGNADGLVATINLEKITGIPETAVRLAYGKGYQYDDGAQTLSNMAFVTVDQNGNKVPMPASALSNNPYVGGDNGGLEDTQFVGLFIDSSIPQLPGSLLQLGIVKANSLNAMGMDVGDALLYGVMAEFTNIADKGVDIFGHYGISQVKSNGAMLPLNMMMGATYMPMGLLSTGVADTDEKTGRAYWVGARYDLSKLGAYGKLGYEYNRGSKNWFSFTQGSNDITNKLATRGSVHELYYIVPINKFAYLRMGYQNINYDYTGSGSPLGAPMSTDSVFAGSFLKELQNLYVQFNLQY